MAKIISLNRCSEFSLEMIGEKAKNLSTISKEYPIPEGFVLPYDFIQGIVEKSGFNRDSRKIILNKETFDELESIYSALNISGDDFLSEKTTSELVIRPSCFPPELNNEVPTIINIQGFKNLIDYLEKDMFAFYEKKSKGGIIVQKLVKPKVSGLVSVSEKIIEIKVNYGYSKSIKEGYFDLITFNKMSKEVSTSIGNKRFAYVFNKETKDIERIEVAEHRAYELSVSKDIINRIIQIASYLHSLGFTEFELVYTDKIVIISAKKGEPVSRLPDEQFNIGEQEKEIYSNDEKDEYINLLSMDLFSEETENETKNRKDNLNFDIEVISFENEKPEQETISTGLETREETDKIKNAIKQAEFTAENFFRIIKAKSNQNYNLTRINEILAKVIKKFVIINPSLEEPLNLLKEEILNELENQK